jgi:hypothetical protein
MPIKLAGKLDEILGRECATRFVGGMIAPDAQRHAITCVGKNELAIRLLFSRQPRRGAFHLHMHARRSRPVLRGPPNLAQRQQLHVDLRNSAATTKAIERINRRR